jgi:transcriptional regulator with XRE-family HTH domain
VARKVQAYFRWWRLLHKSENFRRARMKAGLTQHDIEAHTGIKQAYVSQVESGRINLTLATMITFALAVGKDVDALLKQPASPAHRK